MDVRGTNTGDMCKCDRKVQECKACSRARRTRQGGQPPEASRARAGRRHGGRKWAGKRRRNAEWMCAGKKQGNVWTEVNAGAYAPRGGEPRGGESAAASGGRRHARGRVVRWGEGIAHRRGAR